MQVPNLAAHLEQQDQSDYAYLFWLRCPVKDWKQVNLLHKFAHAFTTAARFSSPTADACMSWFDGGMYKQATKRPLHWLNKTEYRE